MGNKVCHVLVNIVDGVVDTIMADGPVSVTVLDDTGLDFGDPTAVDLNDGQECIVSLEVIEEAIEKFNVRVSHNYSEILKKFVKEDGVTTFFSVINARYKQLYGYIPFTGILMVVLEGWPRTQLNEEGKGEASLIDVICKKVYQTERGEG